MAYITPSLFNLINFVLGIVTVFVQLFTKKNEILPLERLKPFQKRGFVALPIRGYSPRRVPIVSTLLQILE